jgi:hypothetical protein
MTVKEAIMRRMINALRFEPNGVVVEFDEVYPNGLIRQQTLMIPFITDYMDEIMAVQTSVDALLEDVLEDTTLMSPMTEDELRDAAEDGEADVDDGISMNGGS